MGWCNFVFYFCWIYNTSFCVMRFFHEMIFVCEKNRGICKCLALFLFMLSCFLCIKFVLSWHWHFLGMCNVRGGAGKSLAQPTSQCCRTESIVSLERGVCSCAELQIFSHYRGWKEACQATGAISTTSRRELSSGFFPARQDTEGNSCHSDRNIRGTCTIVCHRQKLVGQV